MPVAHAVLECSAVPAELGDPAIARLQHAHALEDGLRASARSRARELAKTTFALGQWPSYFKSRMPQNLGQVSQAKKSLPSLAAEVQVWLVT